MINQFEKYGPLAFGAAGISQTYLERIMGLGYMETQLKIQVHFLMLTLAGVIFVIGSALFIIDFFRAGPRALPTAVVPGSTSPGADEA